MKEFLQPGFAFVITIGMCITLIYLEAKCENRVARLERDQKTIEHFLDTNIFGNVISVHFDMPMAATNQVYLMTNLPPEALEPTPRRKGSIKG